MGKSRRKFLCLDCGIDTGKIKEFYFVTTEIWLQAVDSANGMLCIGCLEKRLGRILDKEDFPNITINSVRFNDKSQRLMSRMFNSP